MSIQNQEDPRESVQRRRLGYDIWTEDGAARRELPFVLGIIGDFSGNARSRKSPENSWQVHEVTVETFDALLAQSGTGIDLQQLQDQLPSQLVPGSQEYRLVTAWRELYRLASRQGDAVEGVRIRLMDVSKQELADELGRPNEESQLFSNLYGKVFGLPGGEPYSMILVDFELSATELDCELLSNMARIAQLVCCPFVAEAASTLLEPDLVQEKKRLRESAGWRALRESEASGFLALTAPRAVQADGVQANGAQAASTLYEYARIWLERVIKCDWFWGVGSELADSGTRRECHLRGFVVAPFDLSGRTERTMYEPAEQSGEFQIDSFHGKLPVMLSCSRFMQYLLVLCRDSIGSFKEVDEFKSYLERWLYQFFSGDSEPNEAAKIQNPMFAAGIEFQEQFEPYSIRLLATLNPYAPEAKLPCSFTFECQLPTCG